MIAETRLHRRSYPQRLVKPAEIIEHEMQCHGMGQILYFFGEGVSQPRESAHRHTHGQVLAFNVGSRNILFGRVAGNSLFAYSAALSRAVTALAAFAFRLAVELVQHSVVNIRAEGFTYC